MASIPSRVLTRITTGLKKLVPVLDQQKQKDIGESDTVVLVNEILHTVFGYDKFNEITSEYAVKSTYCDLAVRLDGKLAILIEVKAIGLELKDTSIKQAVDYGSNEGCDWVILTTGVAWRVYKILFKKPIDFELVCEFDLLNIDLKDECSLEPLWLLCKESWSKESLTRYHAQRQAMSRFMMAAIITSQPVMRIIRRALKKLTPDIKADIEEIEKILLAEVIKRDALDGEKAIAAKAKVTRSFKKSQKTKAEKSDPDSTAIPS